MGTLSEEKEYNISDIPELLKNNNIRKVIVAGSCSAPLNETTKSRIRNIIDENTPESSVELVFKDSLQEMEYDHVLEDISAIEMEREWMNKPDAPIPTRDSGILRVSKHQVDRKCYENKIIRRRKRNKNKKTHKKY